MSRGGGRVGEGERWKGKRGGGGREGERGRKRGRDGGSMEREREA